MVRKARIIASYEVVHSGYYWQGETCEYKRELLEEVVELPEKYKNCGFGP